MALLWPSKPGNCIVITSIQFYFFNKILKFITSNAFLKSTVTDPITSPLSNELYQSLIKNVNAVSHECMFLNPDYDNKLCCVKNE